MADQESTGESPRVENAGSVAAPERPSTVAKAAHSIPLVGTR
jgi:hypothetical protein